MLGSAASIHGACLDPESDTQFLFALVHGGANVVREGMAEREDLLRTELGLDGSHDVVDS